jgi:hypothetical protein
MPRFYIGGYGLNGLPGVLGRVVHGGRRNQIPIDAIVRGFLRGGGGGGASFQEPQTKGLFPPKFAKDLVFDLQRHGVRPDHPAAILAADRVDGMPGNHTAKRSARKRKGAADAPSIDSQIGDGDRQVETQLEHEVRLVPQHFRKFDAVFARIEVNKEAPAQEKTSSHVVFGR